MLKSKLSSGVAHEIPLDLSKKLSSDVSVLERWNDLTPLARNEWICWTVTTKKPETRQNHVDRTMTELLSGKRRPCCWAGCAHRK
ncbi:MAG: YdeI/OmpD-associated family protein [bacterium]